MSVLHVFFGRRILSPVEGGGSGGPGVPDRVSGPFSLTIMGDSIHFLSLPKTYHPNISERFAAIDPRALNFKSAAVSGSDSRDGLAIISNVISLNPWTEYMGLAYGRNDYDRITQQAFSDNMQTLIDICIDAGMTPILPSIAWSEGSGPGSVPYNTILTNLASLNDIPVGPDLYNWFLTHPEELAPDAHPNDTGRRSVQRLWGDSMHIIVP